MGRNSYLFLCSDQWSLADIALVPMLYVCKTVAGHYKGYNKFDLFPNLKQYMENVFATPEFQSTDYPTEYIIQGWAKHFK